LVHEVFIAKSGLVFFADEETINAIDLGSRLSDLAFKRFELFKLL